MKRYVGQEEKTGENSQAKIYLGEEENTEQSGTNVCRPGREYGTVRQNCM